VSDLFLELFLVHQCEDANMIYLMFNCFLSSEDDILSSSQGILTHFRSDYFFFKALEVIYEENFEGCLIGIGISLTFGVWTVVLCGILVG